MEYVLDNGIAGARYTKNYPIPCERCNGIFFYICHDGDDTVAFCGNDKCLKEDSEASKTDAREEYRKRIEKNEYGQIMTGAEKYAMGSSYKHACLSKWMASQTSQNTVNDWIKNSVPFLLIMGSKGTGKTYLSAGVLNLLFEKKEEVFYTTHRRFIEEIQKGFDHGTTQHHSIDKYSYKKYLIIDDLGAATCTDWQQEMILELIDRRYSNQAKTLITTNLDEAEIEEKLGERTKSRIFDQHNKKIECWSKDDNRRNPEFKNYHENHYVD